MTSPGDERTATFVFPDSARQRVLVIGPAGAQTIPMPTSGSLIFGRGTECNVRVDHASVSRKHLALHAGSPPSVEDLGSSNGTRLSGRRIEPRKREVLTPGTIVEMGLATIVLQAGDDELARASIPPPSATQTEGTYTPTMQRLHKVIELVARGRISVILLGETGVGKEVMAETIHRRSPRAKGPFVKINCAALPDNLLEAELFGHEKGAFTGATQAKPGLIETADGGTFLLDEAGELPLSTQVKLLRVLESREVQRLGALKPRAIDVRFLAATNRDLEAQVAAGTFRSDLFYRLNGMSITIPPLRERLDEIPTLARTFVVEECKELDMPEVPITAAAQAALLAHRWPGNVRELRNTIERAVLLAHGGPIDVEHLAQPRAAVVSAMDLPSEVESLERRRILDALEKSDGNQRRAAELLGISRRTLISRLDAYDLPRPKKGKA
jgi:two-component system, NtrC family, response regulator AtoC